MQKKILITFIVVVMSFGVFVVGGEVKADLCSDCNLIPIDTSEQNMVSSRMERQACLDTCDQRQHAADVAAAEAQAQADADAAAAAAAENPTAEANAAADAAQANAEQLGAAADAAAEAAKKPPVVATPATTKPAATPASTKSEDAVKSKSITEGGAAVNLKNPLGDGVTIDDLIKNFIKSILGFGGVLALIAFIYGGIYWLISMGDTNKITKGKNIMIWAVFGLAIVFGSYAIITAIYKVLGLG